MSCRRILAINPNSNGTITAGIDAALDSLRQSGAVQIECVTLQGAPFGIESNEDIATVSPMVVDEILCRNEDFDAFVIACYSDPGLTESRVASQQPVFGIQESAVRLATTRKQPFGVLALSRESIGRHAAYIRRLGMHAFYAGERPLNITVHEGASDPATLDRIIEAGRRLIDQDGARTLILGCAGLTAYRRAAEETLSVPVIDPVQAAGRLALENPPQ